MLPNDVPSTEHVHQPENRLLNLAGPSTIDDDVATLETFSASELLLYPNMTYWIVVRQTSGTMGGLQVATASTAGVVDASSQDGFSLGERGWLRASSFTGNTWPEVTGLGDNFNASMKIQVRGVEPDLPQWGPYVSNRDLQRRADSAQTSSSVTRYATSFTPRPDDTLFDGRHSPNFELTSVLLNVAAETGVTPRVAIHADASGSPAASPLTGGTLTAPSEISRALDSPARAMFTASSPITVDLDTTYWVVLDVGSGSGELSVGTTASDDNDRYRHLIDWDASPWDIGDGMKEFDGTSWSADSTGRSFRMALNGTTDLYSAELEVHPPQVGLETLANIHTRSPRIRNASWQWQLGETSEGPFTNIPAERGGTAAAYVPVQADLDKWLKATVTYTNAFGAVTLSAVSLQPVLSHARVSNTGIFRVLRHEAASPDASMPISFAQSFTTGNFAGGYILRGLRLGFMHNKDIDYTVTWSIHADDEGMPAAAPLFTPLDKPTDDLDSDDLTLEELPHPGFHLDPGNRYWAVITSRSNDPSLAPQLNLSAVSQHGAGIILHDAYGFDPGSEPGWLFHVPTLGSYEEPAQQAWIGWRQILRVSGKAVLRMSVLADRRVTASFTQASYDVAESDNAATTGTAENQVTVTVELSADPEKTTTIPITRTGLSGATAEDYSGVPQELVFAPGETTKDFTVTIEDDSDYEYGEVLNLSFGDLPDTVTSGDHQAVTIRIGDDDRLAVSFAEQQYTVREGAAQSVSVTLSADPERTTVVPILAALEAGASAADYSGVPAELTFSAGQTTQSFQFTAILDVYEDDNERVRLSFGDLPAWAEPGMPAATTVTIADADRRLLLNGALRLLDGATYAADGRLCEGRVEIYYNGAWGTICDDYWNSTDVDVACRALGFAGGASGHAAILQNRDTRFGRAAEYNEYLRLGTCPEDACGDAANQGVFYDSHFGSGSGEILLDDVRCSGTEQGLLECSRNQGEHNCSLAETAGLRCLKEAPPRVVYIAVSDPPGGNGRYDAGETVEITLVWSVPVVVTTPDGELPPKVWVGFDDNTTGVAPYVRGSGTTHTVFSHTLDRGSYDAVEVIRDTVRERGGSIRSAALGLPAVLKHEGYPDILTEASPAKIVTAPVIRGPEARDTWGPGDTIEVTFNFDLPVDVAVTNGTPSVPVYLSGTAERDARYSRGSGSTQVVFSYTLTEADGTHDAVLVQPNSLELNGGAITDVYFSKNVKLDHSGGAQVLPLLGFLPGVQAATVDGATLTLTYAEDLDTTVTLPLTAFAVQVNESPRTISAVAVSGSNVTLTLESAVASGDSVTVDYARPDGIHFIKDTRGRGAVSFSGLVVTNNTPSSSNQVLEANTPATGVPGITSADRTLTVDTSGIADEDGLSNPQFSYQWIRHDFDSRTDTDIAGATGSAYTLTAEDTGNAIKVRVTFTDDAGNRESLTSYPLAVAPPPLEQQEEENSPATGEPYVTGTPQVGQTLIVEIYDIADEDGLTGATYSYQWIRHDPVAGTGADIEGETGETYTVTAADEGKAIKVRVTFTDDAGNEETLTSEGTAPVTAAPEPGLSLSDLDVGAGQELLAAALIKAGDRGRKSNESQDRAWYATDTPAWHASGELRDGSLTWSGMTLNRVAYFPNTRALRFNVGDAGFHLGDSFAEGGVNRDLTIWVKTDSGTVSFLARDHILSSGSSWINFEVPEAAKPVLDAIATDDLIIVAVSAPHPS